MEETRVRKRSKWFGLLLAGLLVAAVGAVANAGNDEVRFKVERQRWTGLLRH